MNSQSKIIIYDKTVTTQNIKMFVKLNKIVNTKVSNCKYFQQRMLENLYYQHKWLIIALWGLM